MDSPLRKLAHWVLSSGRWETAVLIVLIVVAPFLTFYNLEFNPRPWHDEGAFLSVPKTLVQDGVYATRSSDGYQTFGPVQSMGPTVLLPVALSFRLFGIGLVQARLVSASYALLALAVFYKCGLELFGRRTALIAVILLLASPAVGFLLYGRPVLGEVPALGFFLLGWLAWARGIRTGRKWWYPLAGLFIGAAMVTKTQYIVVGFGTLVLLAILDQFYYRQKSLWGLIVVGLISLICVAAWWGWQAAYFGLGTFLENAAKLRQLAASTTGFRLHTTVEAIKLLVGSGSGYFYFFWGFLALIYGAFLCRGRNKDSLVRAFLLLFAVLWLGYFTFWIIPWSRYILPAAAITALFVGAMWNDLAAGYAASHRDLWSEIRRSGSAGSPLTPQALLSLGTLVALVSMGLLVGYHLQRIVRSDVLDKVGQESVYAVSPPQLASPSQLALILNEKIGKDEVIETWDREMSILTDHRYHFPDQSLLARTDVFIYHAGARDYILGSDYFNQVRPSFVIVGWYSRWNQIYDMDFLTKYGDLVTTVGEGEWRYDVYKLHLP